MKNKAKDQLSLQKTTVKSFRIKSRIKTGACSHNTSDGDPGTCATSCGRVTCGVDTCGQSR